MIRILHSVSNMDRGGIETMLMNYYRNIDRSVVQFDFLCNKMKPGDYDAEIKDLGGHIYHTPSLNPIKFSCYVKAVTNLFRQHPEYHIIEAHNGPMGYYPLYVADKINIPIRIFHAHNTNITHDYKLPLKLFCKSKITKHITHQFSCGIAAAEYYYGKNKNITIIPNAIDTEMFSYNEEIRQKLRSLYNITNKKVIGHIGRFVKVKNQSFLLDVFNIVHKYDPQTVLVLIGEGAYEYTIKHKVHQLGLDECVIFTGSIGNTNEWYQVFDIFTLPSLNEGLPVVGIEAQAADLPCLFSDSITREIAISENTHFIPITSAKVWADFILNVFSSPIKREDKSKIIIDNNYDIKEEAKKLQDLYLSLWASCLK